MNPVSIFQKSAFLGYFCLVMGTLEFMDWLAGGRGLIAGWLNFPTAFLAPPLIASYFILSAAWSEPLRELIRERVFSRWQLMLHPWTYIISPFIQGIFYVSVIWIIREIFELVSKSECNLNCSDLFSPENASFLFFAFFFCLFFLQFVLRNLPEVKELREKFLPVDSVGLYGLKHDQFILEEILGASTTFKLIQGSCRYFKEKKAIWFIFSQRNCELKTACNFEVGFLEIKSDYQAIVTDNPQHIEKDKIPLAGIESREQLASVIEKDFIRLFRQDICNRPDYQKLDRQLENFFQNGIKVAGSLEELAPKIVQAAWIRLNLEKIRTELLNHASSSFDFYGNLYQLEFQLREVRIVSQTINQLDRFEKTIQQWYSEIYQRTQDKQEFNLELWRTVIKAANEAQGIIPRSELQHLLNNMVASMFPQGTPKEVVEELEKLPEENS
jgi:hypothetical protein